MGVWVEIWLAINRMLQRNGRNQINIDLARMGVWIETRDNNMQKEIYTNLYDNRLLKNNEEIEIFEENLELLSETFTEEDIIELCSVFDDKTQDVEVMFGAIHLLETLSSEKAFENTINGVVEMSYKAPEWSNIIICRCLNDEFSVQMISKVQNKVDIKTYDRFKELLFRIKED